MAKATTMATAAVQAEGDALTALTDNGYIRIYDGAQPATADTAPSGSNHLLAELRFAADSAPATSVAGLITFSAIADGVGLLDGTPAWYRCLKSDGSTPVMDGDAGVAAGTPNMVLGSATIAVGAVVSITSFTHSIAKTTAGL